MLKQIITSSGISISFTCLQAFLSLFLAGYSLRIFGENIIGNFYLIQAIYLFFLPFLGSQVLKPALTQYIAEAGSRGDEKKTNSILNSILGYTLFSNVFLSGLILSYYFFLQHVFLDSTNDHKAPLSLILIALTVLSGFFDEVGLLFTAFLCGKKRLEATYLINGIIGIVTQVGLFLAAYLTKSFSVYVCIFMAKSAVGFLCLYFLIYKTYRFFPLPNFRFRQILSLPMVKRSAYVGSLSDPLGSQADKLILGFIGGISALPVYTIAQRVIGTVHSVIYNITYSFFPLLAAEGDNAINKARQIDARQRWSIGILGALLYGATILIFPSFFSIAAGKEIGIKSLPFIILASIQGILVCNASIPIMGLLALKQTKTLAINGWSNQGLLLGATAILTLLWGAIGTAAARMVFLFQMGFATYQYTKILGGKNLVTMFRPIFPSICLVSIVAIASFFTAHISSNMWIVITVNSLFLIVSSFVLFVAEYQTVLGKESIFFLKGIVNRITYSFISKLDDRKRIFR